MFTKAHISNTSFSYLLGGSLLLLIGLGTALFAYYFHGMSLHPIAFGFIVLGIITLFMSVFFDIDRAVNNKFYSILILGFLLLLYFVLRFKLSRFDFGVGDAADYYVAGVCSVTYGQDIGFFLPLTASISALGYSMFGSDYAPFIHVLLYVASLPVAYFIMRKMSLTICVSLFMLFLFIVNPLSIWFSKTSFTEPLWQLLLLIFVFLFYQITSKKSLKFTEIMGLFLLLGIVPFLRGEGVLYYGLVFILSFYHFWKFQHFKSAFVLMLGLMVLAMSIHLTLGIREHYLLGWQFSRIIPHITQLQLMSILYGSAGFSLLLLSLSYFIKKGFAHIPLPLVITFLAILFKVLIASLFAQKKSLPFEDILFFNEYGIVLGNFGLPLTLLIGVGLLLLHFHALKGERIALLLVVMYAIFDLPFVMQGVTFYDPHELFLYWNRYYFSILMMVHLFGLGLLLQAGYSIIHFFIKDMLVRVLTMGIVILSLLAFSFNLKVGYIVATEAYLENSDKVFTWIYQKVGRNPLLVVYDDGIRYERHNGVYDAKVFVSRMFSVRKINAKAWKKIKVSELSTPLILDEKSAKMRYVVVISSQKPKFTKSNLLKVADTMIPISWREHYQAQPTHKNILQGDVSHSKRNYLDLYISIYKTQ
jgi:hypothetical protein